MSYVLCVMQESVLRPYVILCAIALKVRLQWKFVTVTLKVE